MKCLHIDPPKFYHSRLHILCFSRFPVINNINEKKDDSLLAVDGKSGSLTLPFAPLIWLKTESIKNVKLSNCQVCKTGRKNKNLYSHSSFCQCEHIFLSPFSTETHS